MPSEISSDKHVKKRKQVDEIEIDLSEETPLSKKQQRLLKKGKLDRPKVKSTEPTESTESDQETVESKKPKPRSEFGIWIGNLSFDTKKDDIRRFLVYNSNDQIQPSSILRVKVDRKQGGGIKGYAYVDLESQQQVDAAIALSEQVLNKRALLIKNANSFEGRPAVAKGLSKNDPSKILFVGNLAFDTTEEDLQMTYQHCGPIRRIRMATFEDSGKCKGFAFIDFQSVESAGKAMKDKRCSKILGRSVRLEFGEDRSKTRASSAKKSTRGPAEGIFDNEEPIAPETRPVTPSQKPIRSTNKIPAKPQSSGAALANAQRAKPTIQPSMGTKKVF